MANTDQQRRAGMDSLSLGVAYAVSCGAVILASLARWLADPLLGDDFPFITFFAAVIVASLVGGFWTGVFGAVTSGLTAWYFFIPLRFSFQITERRDAFALALFLLVSLAIAGIGEAMRRANNRAQQQSQTFRTTLASIGDAVITTDDDGRIKFLNPVAEEITGWSDDSARGQSLAAVFRIINEITREPAENPVERVLKSGFVVGLANHTLLIRKDGSERPIDDSAAPIRDDEGRVTGVVLVFRDVSERRRRELAIGRLAAIIESSSDAIIGKDLCGIVTSWNPAAERMFGYTAKEMVGQPITTLIPEGHLDEEPEILQKISQGEVLSHFETVRRRKDGTLIPISLTISPVHDASGRIVGASTIARDITEQKQAERDLRHALSELSEEDRRKSEFLATLSHELRNPLAPIRNAVEILKRVDPNADGEAAKSAVDLLERHVGHVVRLVDDLLDVSRINRGKIELRKQAMELAPVVKQAVETVQPHYDSRNHQLSIVLPPEPIYLNADPNRVAQMIVNLLDNACKFTEPGGRVRVAVDRKDGAAVIRVQDTGIGISAEHLPRIFQMFAQVDTSLQRSEGGLGIGLGLVKTLVELHGGTVDAHSLGVDQGSEFVVRLPTVAGPPEPPLKQKPVAPQSAVVRRRILIVDDNQDAANSLAMLLKVAGHRVDTAHDGQDAVEAALNIEPDVILLDIGLPTLNGYEAARRIRQQQKSKQPLLIALTGWGQDEDRRRSQEAGFDAHLVKPVDYAVLNKLLSDRAPTTI